MRVAQPVARRGAAAFTRRSAGADVSLVFLRGPRDRDGTRSIAWCRWDARLERDTDVRFETVTLDDLLAVTAGASLRPGDPGRVPEQPARTLDAADGGERERERRELRGPERGPCWGTRRWGVCGGSRKRRRRMVALGKTPFKIRLLFRRGLAATNGAQRPHEYHSLVGAG